jgi:hypothetical protein
MKAERDLGHLQASLSTPYGKIQAIVMDSRRVGVMTGWRKPRLQVGGDRVRVNFDLVHDAGGAWRLDTYYFSFEGGRGQVKADVRSKIVRAVTSAAISWEASLPRSAVVSAERDLFRHNKRATFRHDIPDLIFTFRNNAEILELGADSYCLAGANPAVYERMRELARKMRALIEPVKEYGREVRAVQFAPIGGGCERAAA